MHLFDFEANHPARQFYEALGGKVVEQYAQKTTAGVVVPSSVSYGRNPGR
jgi:predicted lactoylglutathione lyase